MNLAKFPDKSEDKNTTSHKFKQDLFDFFVDKELKNVLEIGTFLGFTTNVLSQVFKKVFTVEARHENVLQAIENNIGNNNITYLNKNAYNPDTYNSIPEVDAVFIDCVHDSFHVTKDINTALRVGGENVYLVFDDYGHPHLPGVHHAVHQRIGKDLDFVQFIGQDKDYQFKGGRVKLVRREGIICKRKKL